MRIYTVNQHNQLPLCFARVMEKKCPDVEKYSPGTNHAHAQIGSSWRGVQELENGGPFNPQTAVLLLLCLTTDHLGLL